MRVPPKRGPKPVEDAGEWLRTRPTPGPSWEDQPIHVIVMDPAGLHADVAAWRKARGIPTRFGVPAEPERARLDQRWLLANPLWEKDEMKRRFKTIRYQARYAPRKCRDGS